MGLGPLCQPPRDPCTGYTQDGTPRWNRKPPLSQESGFAADTGCPGLRWTAASWQSGAASATGHPLRGPATGSGTGPNRPVSSPACGVGPRGTQGPHETAETQRGKRHAPEAQPGDEGEPGCGTGACQPFLSPRCRRAGGRGSEPGEGTGRGRPWLPQPPQGVSTNRPHSLALTQGQAGLIFTMGLSFGQRRDGS